MDNVEDMEIIEDMETVDDIEIFEDVVITEDIEFIEDMENTEDVVFTEGRAVRELMEAIAKLETKQRTRLEEKIEKKLTEWYTLNEAKEIVGNILERYRANRKTNQEVNKRENEYLRNLVGIEDMDGEGLADTYEYLVEYTDRVDLQLDKLDTKYYELTGESMADLYE